MFRVDIKPEMLRWARQRADLSVQHLSGRFPMLEAWERGEVKPTLKQLEAFARATYMPIGFLFLSEPLLERVPIPDLRTVGNRRIAHPSPNLLDTVYVCQQRQDWYHGFARLVGEERREFVRSARTTDGIESTAEAMRRVLGFDLEHRRTSPTWTDALRQFIEQAESIGVLVMCSGVVQNNNGRRLDPEEFRGFALVDDFAPLVFVNGADTKAAQMFTLAHELAHIWLGQTALSDAQASDVPDQEVERWCNRVAAELLVPLRVLRDEYDPRKDVQVEANRLARRFKVSSLVVLRRMQDAGGLTRNQLRAAYDEALQRLQTVPRTSGGDFYLTQAARASKRFTRALIVTTLEGQTSFTEAFRMLGFKKMATFHELGRSLGLSM